jgi:hypothetical protein
MPLHARQTLLAISFVPSLVVCHREQLIEADEVFAVQQASIRFARFNLTC